MLEGGKISNNQLVKLFLITVSSTAILFGPTISYRYARQDSWLSIILAAVYGIVLISIITSLGMIFKGKTIIQYSEIAVGKVLGKPISLLYCLFFIYINAFVVREFSELLVGVFLPETPMGFFTIAIIIASTYAVRKGLEVIARINDLFFPLYVVAFIAVFALVIQEMDFKNLAPVLAEGFMPVLEGAYINTVWFSEAIIAAMFIPYINKPGKTFKPLLLAVILLGLVGALTLIGVVATFGSQIELLEYPVLSLARYIRASDFLIRADPFIVFMWIAGVFVKIAVFHYCAVLAIAQLLSLKDYRPLVMPIGIILAVLSIVLFSNIIELINQIERLIPVLGLVIQGGIPAVLLIVAKLRKRGK